MEVYTMAETTTTGQHKRTFWNLTRYILENVFQTPKDRQYFDWFDEMATIAQKTATTFLDVNDSQKRSILIDALEHDGDVVASTIYKHLEIDRDPPLETPEHLENLTHQLDNLIDHVDDAAQCMHLYQLNLSDDEQGFISEFGELLCRATDCIVVCMSLLRDIRQNHTKLRELGIELKSIESEGDKIYNKARAWYGVFVDDLMEMHRKNLLKDVYVQLEKALDAIQDVAVAVDKLRRRNP
jgi:uncharacterized protein Yka (UPF0111/DUF47 family)